MDNPGDRPSRHYQPLATFEVGLVRPPESPGFVAVYVSRSDRESVDPYLWRLTPEGFLPESMFDDVLAVVSRDVTETLMTRVTVFGELFRSVEQR